MSGSWWRGGRGWLWVVGLTVALRGGVLFLERDALAADPDAYRALAENVREQGVLGSGTRPSAFRPPLYPMMLVPLVGLDWWGVAALHFGLGLSTVLLTGLIAQRLGRGQLAPLAMLLVAGDPVLLRQSTVVMTETLATCCVAVVLWVAAGLVRRGIWAALLWGAALGLAVLTRPTFLAWAALEILALVWLGMCGKEPASVSSATAERGPDGSVRQSGGDRRRMTMVLGLVGLIAVVAPWVVRNARVFGRPIVGTTHGGFTLLLANNAEFYAHLRTAPWGEVWDSAAFNAEVTPQLRRNSTAAELASNRRAYALAGEAIGREPGMFAWSCLVRLGRLWSPLAHRVDASESSARKFARWAIAGFYACEWLLAGYGLWRLRGELGSEPWRGIVLLALALSATHALYWSDLRMRAPLTPGIALIASVGWQGFFASAWTQRKR